MSSVKNLTCFKAYDVRGKLGREFNESIAYRSGRATAQSLKAKTVAVAFDARATTRFGSGDCKRDLRAGADVWILASPGQKKCTQP